MNMWKKLGSIVSAGALVTVVGASLGACATAQETERKAQLHDQRADQYAAARDYDRAAAEKERANELHRKAINKAQKEGTSLAPAPVETSAPAPVPGPEYTPPPATPAPTY